MALEKLSKAARRISSRLGGDAGIVITLKGEHAELKSLLQRTLAEGGDRASRREAYASLRERWLQHARAEAEIVYPACQRQPELRAMVRDELAEHDQIEERLAQLDATDPGAAEWSSQLGVLQALVDHHVEHQEEHLLPHLAARVSDDDLSDIDGLFRAARDRIADATDGTSQPHATFEPN